MTVKVLNILNVFYMYHVWPMCCVILGCQFLLLLCPTCKIHSQWVCRGDVIRHSDLLWLIYLLCIDV